MVICLKDLSSHFFKLSLPDQIGQLQPNHYLQVYRKNKIKGHPMASEARP